MRTSTALNLRHAPIDNPVCGKTAETEFGTNIAFRYKMKIRAKQLGDEAESASDFRPSDFPKVRDN
jgi:hypothetical protein